MKVKSIGNPFNKEPWEETYDSEYLIKEPDFKHVCANDIVWLAAEMIRKFNASLRQGEFPRKLIEVTKKKGSNMQIKDVAVEIRKIAKYLSDGINDSKEIAENHNNSPHVQIGALKQTIKFNVDSLNDLADRIERYQTL